MSPSRSREGLAVWDNRSLAQSRPSSGTPRVSAVVTGRDQDEVFRYFVSLLTAEAA